eukprot:3366596-Rhodomonas_salina.1
MATKEGGRTSVPVEVASQCRSMIIAALKQLRECVDVDRIPLTIGCVPPSAMILCNVLQEKDVPADG